MPFFTLSGNKLATTVLAAGALVLGGTGVAAMADSLQDNPGVQAGTEQPSPTAETESPEPTPTETETESPEPTPTETETDAPEPAPTETDDPAPAPPETEDPDGPPASTPVGPDVTGPAAVGLCNAFSHGGLNSTSTPYSLLVEVAGGEEGIEDYCATIPAPEDDTDNGTTDDGTDADADEDAVEPQPLEPQPVEPQRQNAAASNGGASSGGTSNGGAGQPGNSAKNSNNGRK